MRWTVKQGETCVGGPLTQVVAEDGRIICDNEPYYPQALDPKDADLIAASPVLLEAVESALLFVDAIEGVEARILRGKLEEAKRQAQGLPF